jgi:hypothetical protein
MAGRSINLRCKTAQPPLLVDDGRNEANAGHTGSCRFCAGYLCNAAKSRASKERSSSAAKVPLCLQSFIHKRKPASHIGLGYLLTRASADRLRARCVRGRLSQDFFRQSQYRRALPRLGREYGWRVRRCVLSLAVRSTGLAPAAHAVAARMTLQRCTTSMCGHSEI